MTDERKCLHCYETKASLKAQGIDMCGIEGGYEYRELIDEWPRHRWADWTDKELARFRIKPEAFEKYRRHPIREFEYVACEDTTLGHNPITENEDIDWGLKVGQCFFCGKMVAPVAG